jgi:hypothetical protein
MDFNAVKEQSHMSFAELHGTQVQFYNLLD